MINKTFHYFNNKILSEKKKYFGLHFSNIRIKSFKEACLTEKKCKAIV